MSSDFNVFKNGYTVRSHQQQAHVVIDKDAIQRTLQNIANTTGYSYEFWNVLLFIIIEPLICFALLITTMFKSDKVRFVLGFIIALGCVLLFNYISEHYVLFSKTAEIMMN